MSDELLDYYERELRFIRGMGGAFAQAHPKIAGRLRLDADASTDPHVERLIEAFAFLAARVRKKIDDDLPELTEALAESLFPGSLAPFPSVGILRMTLDRASADLLPGFTVERGALVETESTAEGTCFYRTAHDVTLFPIEVKAAALAAMGPHEAASHVRLDLASYSKEPGIGQFAIKTLRFYLGGDEATANRLYALILSSVFDVTVGRPEDKNPRRIGAAAITPAGFSDAEALLPTTPRIPSAHRILREFFAFPRKFLAFDLHLPAAAIAALGPTAQVRILLNKSSPDLEKIVSAQTFLLGCVPVINLFRKTCDPVRLTGRQHEYRIVPDARQPLAHEIYSVDAVAATTADGATRPYYAFHALRHHRGAAAPPDGRNAPGDDTAARYYNVSRRTATTDDGLIGPGTDLYVALVDQSLSPAPDAGSTLVVQTTCLSRDLPRMLPAGGKPQMRLVDGGPLTAVCLTPLTPTIRPDPRYGAMWRLVSQLALNHTTLLEPDAFREALRVHKIAQEAEADTRINAIIGIEHERVVTRIGGPVSGGFARGLRVRMTFAEERLSDHSLYLLASVIERFVALYANVNSFTQLVAVGDRSGEIKKWPPRLGDQVLV